MLRAIVGTLALLSLAGSAAALPCAYGDNPALTGGYGVCLLNVQHTKVGYADANYRYSQVQDVNAPLFVSDVASFGPAGVTTNAGAQQVDYGTAYSYTYPGYAGGGTSKGRLTMVGLQGGVGTSSPLGEAYFLGFQQNGVEGATYNEQDGATSTQRFQSNATFVGLFMCDTALRCTEAGLHEQRSSYDDGTRTSTFDETWLGAGVGGIGASYQQASDDGGPCQQWVDVLGFDTPASACTVRAPWVEDAPTFPPPPL